MVLLRVSINISFFLNPESRLRCTVVLKHFSEEEETFDPLDEERLSHLT